MADAATKEVENKTQPASTEQDKGVETKKADDTASSEAPKSEPTPQVDYKAEYERLSKTLDQAEHTIVKLKTGQKQSKSPGPDDQPVDDTDYTTAEELTRNIEKNLDAKYQKDMEAREAKIRKELAADTISEELTMLSGNPDEQKLIEFHYQNTIRQSGFSRAQIREDLHRAKLIANEKVLLRENEELKEALKSKNSASKGTIATNQDREEVWEEPKFSPQERTVLQRRADAAGLSFKEFVRRHPELKK